jgi:hypothetical protein
MNKYDAKILEIASEDVTIYELMRRTIKSPLVHFIDIMLNSTLMAADAINSKGTYYLLLDETKADIVHIERNLDVSHKDVTHAIQVSLNKKSFEWEGQRYKLYRKIR